jgi:hypothetical protein
MQTFLPYADFDESAKCLDSKRLGNQAYREGKTLIDGGWKNHPASKMWKGYEYALAEYCLACLRELQNRGRHYPQWFEYFENKKNQFQNTGLPPWIGNKEFHDSHKSNLMRKDKEHYSKYFGDFPDNLPYIWPIR